MSIQVKGYDINTYDLSNDESNAVIIGVAHLESSDGIADVPFEARHEKGMTGFIEFILKDPDEIDVPEIRNRADDIRDLLAEHLLEAGYEPGEYSDTLTIK